MQRQAADNDEARRQRRHQEMYGTRDEIASRQEADREARLQPAVERASLDRSPHSTAFERQAQDALYRTEEARREQAAREAARRAERAQASLGAAQLRDETGRAEVVAELELIFPTASRVHIERALEAAIQIGGDRNEAALLLLEPDEV